MRRGFNAMTDAELAALSQRGDLQAFSNLVRRWDGPLYRFILHLLRNQEDARDACQDALLKAYLNIGRLRDPAKFKAWLHHIALNLCRDRRRSTQARITQAFDEGHADAACLAKMASSHPAPDKEAERTHTAELLDTLLGRLSLEQRTAILLREYQGFTSEEIGQIAGVSAGTVRTRIFYGLKSMRKMLREQGISNASLLQGDDANWASAMRARSMEMTRDD